MLRRMKQSKAVGYSPKFDAYYSRRTGKWLCAKCGDRHCGFCATRPKRHHYPRA